MNGLKPNKFECVPIYVMKFIGHNWWEHHHDADDAVAFSIPSHYLCSVKMAKGGRSFIESHALFFENTQSPNA